MWLGKSRTDLATELPWVTDEAARKVAGYHLLVGLDAWSDYPGGHGGPCHRHLAGPLA